ncbi:MAG TPA: ABC transporter permease [Terriglobales bacterium]|nr:ABC transporter permease [Terriglobales bacterium]
MNRRRLARYIAQRLLLLLPLAFLVSLFVFLLASIVPGGPVAAIIGSHPLNEVTIEQLRHKYHLDQPIYQQYWGWLTQVVIHHNLGRSILTQTPVSSSIGARIWLTLTLNLGGIAFALFFGIPLGVLSAVKRGRPLDRGAVAFTIFFGNAPAFVISLVGLYVFGLKLGWVPLFGDGTAAIGDRLHHLILPILVLGIAGMALIMRITRAAMIDQLDQDYIVFARARGLTSRRVIAFYAFRNALIPVLTAAGLLLIGVLTGAPFVETVFGLPGLGSLLVSSVQNVDIPVIQGLVLIVAAWIIIANILIDIAYAVIDPRVGFEKAAA